MAAPETTPEQRRDVQLLWEAGLAVCDIAKQTNLKEQKIRTWASRYGWKRTVTRKRVSQPITQSITVPITQQIRAKLSEKPPETRDQVCRDLIERGAPQKLAEKLMQMLEADKPTMQADGSVVMSSDWQAVGKAIEHIRKVLGYDAPIRSEMEIKLEIRAIIGVVRDVIAEFVPEDKRNEAVDRILMAVENGR